MKLWEQQGAIGGSQTALWLLLACSNGRGGGDFMLPNYAEPSAELLEFTGRWAGQRIAIVGDYIEDDDLPHEWEPHKLYQAIREEPGTVWVEIGAQMRPVLESVLEGVTYATENRYGMVARTLPTWMRS